MLKLRIVSVDLYGFTGRDFHPKREDEGLVVEVVAMEAEIGSMILTPNSFSSIPSANLRRALSGDEFVRVFYCLTKDGRKLQLVEHEVELELNQWKVFARNSADVRRPIGVARNLDEAKELIEKEKLPEDFDTFVFNVNDGEILHFDGTEFTL